MNATDYLVIVTRMKNNLAQKSTEIKAESYRAKYGTLAEKLFGYSKRVGQLEGYEAPDNAPEPTETDLVLARAIAEDVRGDGWEGSGQGIMKMFSIFLGKNLWSKQVGMKTTLKLPKATLVKNDTGKIGLISTNGKSFTLDATGKLQKDTYYDTSNVNLTVPSLDDTLLFLGGILDNDSAKRTLSSTFEISSADDFDTMLSVANNGLDMQMKDQLDYKTHMANINPNLSTGYGGVSCQP